MTTPVKEVSTFFVQNEEQNDIIDSLREYSANEKRQVYIIRSPLGNNDFEYDYEKGMMLLIPDFKIIFLNEDSEDSENFTYYINDVLNDIDNISLNFKFRKRIKRSREWKTNYVTDLNLCDFSVADLNNYYVESSSDRRDINIIISLLIGSINSLEKIGDETPSNILDEVKQKIILFDGDQTRFIFKPTHEKVVSIQGLAGTGKTELLLHKLKELYLENENNRIALTCHSKTLANSLNKRVPEFFTLMKVMEQIDWNERLWVMAGWGSETNPISGIYSYICTNYAIPFQRYSNLTNMDIVCKNAIENLIKIPEIEPCFDYILIDESQDFPSSFFDLCELVVAKTIFTAGDIFQKITDDVPEMNSVSYLLNRCYRTDNRTLMFAHALGLGLFEKKALNWFTDSEWELFGYSIVSKDVTNNDLTYKLSRTPMRRFDDIADNVNPFTKLVRCNNDDCIEDVIKVIKEIKSNNPTVEPDDIAIVYVTPSRDNYNQMERLCIEINNEFDWSAVKGYDTKRTRKGSVFVTNKYNLKGLEFPFIICVANKGINSNLSSRNTLYMSMTRSFISSYLLLTNTDPQLFRILEDGLNSISNTGMLIINEPKEIMDKTELVRVVQEEYKSQYDIAEEIFNKNKIPGRMRPRLRKMLYEYDENTVDRNKIEKFILINKGLLENG